MDLLLILRGLAAISVVIWHAGGHAAGLPLINVPGRTAVWLFFGLSGYVIAHGFIHRRYVLDRQGLSRFYLNRFLRIYPLFLLLSILGWATMWATTGQSPIGWRDIPAQFLALQFNQDYKLNSVFWTLGIEIQFYLLAPVLVLLFLSGRYRWAIAATMYLSAVALNWFAVRQGWWSADGRNILATLPHFIAGTAGCSLVADLKPAKVRFCVCLFSGAAVLMLTNWLYHREAALFWTWRGIVLVDAMILLFIAAHASLPPMRPYFVLRGLLVMGTLSYGIYAWHAYLMATFPPLADNWEMLLFASIGLAWVSYRLAERPALALKAVNR